MVILFTALGLAVVRGLPGPVFFPLRLLAIVYSDVFRGIPTILLIYLLGFGIPALGLAYVSEPELLWGVPAEMVWGTVALILVYTAYVSGGVPRRHRVGAPPSQNAAARSARPRTGSRCATSSSPGGAPGDPAAAQRLHRPPEGHGARRADRGRRGVRTSQIDSSATFNFTPYPPAERMFLLITIPLTRLTDYLIERDRRRRQTGAIAI